MVSLETIIYKEVEVHYSIFFRYLGNEKSKKMGDVLQENKEMLDSFTIISDELSTLAKNLRASEEQKLLQEKVSLTTHLLV